MEDKQILFIDKQRLIKTFILLIWALFISYMILSGRYRNYLHPSLVWMLITAVIMLIPMSLALFSRLRTPHAHDKNCLELNRPCSYSHRLKFSDIKPLLVFSIPVMIVFLLPLSQGLSATMAGGIFTEEFDKALVSKIAEQKRKKYRGIPEYVISEILAAPAEVPEKAAVKGMVYKSKKVEKPRFLLVRFYITCCAADARPLMLEIVPAETSGLDYNSLSNNEWVVCTGTAEQAGKKVFFSASAVKTVPKPEDEYMY